LYTADVTAIAAVRVHTYADDTQLYTFCSAADGAAMATQLLRCIDDEFNKSAASSRLSTVFLSQPPTLSETSA